MAIVVTLKADRNAILKKITNSKAFVEKGWNAAEKIARRKYESSKKMFFRDFNAHPVTTEIEGGTDASNSSGLLGGKANLFSFFGFDEESSPIADLRFYLENSFFFARGSYRSRSWSFRIKAPDKEKVEEYVVGKYGADYTSESWVRGVEKGYSGLKYYLRYKGKGRSGGGIQSKYTVQEIEFKTTKYLSNMIDGFKRNIDTTR